MLNFSNKIKLFNNCKKVNQLKERLPYCGLYNFFHSITQGPKAYQRPTHSLDVSKIIICGMHIRSHASVKQLGQAVSISMILHYDSSHVKESEFENCCSEAGLLRGAYLDIVTAAKRSR